MPPYAIPASSRLRMSFFASAWRKLLPYQLHVHVRVFVSKFSHRASFFEVFAARCPRDVPHNAPIGLMSAKTLSDYSAFPGHLMHTAVPGCPDSWNDLSEPSLVGMTHQYKNSTGLSVYRLRA